LADLIAQMVSELSALHIFVFPWRRAQGPDEILPGRLGAALVRDAKAGGYRIERIYRHDPTSRARRAAGEAGVNLKAGCDRFNRWSPDLSQRHRRTASAKAGRQVLLAVKPAKGEARSVIVKPLSVKEDDDLRYHEWEFTRRVQPTAGGGDTVRAPAKRCRATTSTPGRATIRRSQERLHHRRAQQPGRKHRSWIIGPVAPQSLVLLESACRSLNQWNMQYGLPRPRRCSVQRVDRL